MKGRKRGFFLPALIILFLLFEGCDNPGKRQGQVFVEIKPRTPEKKAGAAEEEFVITKEEMEKIYGFILLIRENLKKLGDKALEAKGKDPEAFAELKARFTEQSPNWHRLIVFRKNKLKAARKMYPPPHPAHSLYRALEMLDREMDSYWLDIYDRKPYDPSFDERLLKLLKESRKQLDDYKWSLESSPKESKDQGK